MNSYDFINSGGKYFSCYSGWVHKNEMLQNLQKMFENVKEWYRKNGINIGNDVKLYVLPEYVFDALEHYERENNIPYKYTQVGMFVFPHETEHDRRYKEQIMKRMIEEMYGDDPKRVLEAFREDMEKKYKFDKVVKSYLIKEVGEDNINNVIFINSRFVVDYVFMTENNKKVEKIIEGVIAHELWHIYENERGVLHYPHDIVAEGSAHYIQELYQQETLGKDMELKASYFDGVNRVYFIAKEVLKQEISAYLHFKEKERLLLNEGLRMNALKKIMKIVHYIDYVAKHF